jgi:hypothetical protein
MWYHFAFVAISVALFGMTVGALAVHMLPHRFPPAATARQLWQFAVLFGVAIAVCFAVQLAIPFTPRATLAGVASVVLTCVVISVPFVFSGVVVCLALTRFPGRVNRLYAADLVGAGLGCVLLVVLFSWLDGPSLVILVGALAATGAIAFAGVDHSRRGLVITSVAALVLAGFAGINGYRHANGDPVLRIIWTKEARDPDHLYERWNAFSRLTVDGDPDNPAADSLHLVIDSTAGTRLVRFRDPSDSDILRDVIQNLPHHLRSDADVFVVGVGGGTDVLSALEFEQRSVTGAEINGDIMDIANGVFGDFTGHLDRDPRVHLVNDEARSYLARTSQRYDLIQISLIDTWAATAAGAFALTENSLYTTDAWGLFMDRLQDDGILSVTRYYRTTNAEGRPVEPLETYRTIALAADVLTERGVDDPRDHIMVYRVPTAYRVDLATVLVSPRPFSARDREIVADRADALGFTPVPTSDVAEDPMLAALTTPGGPGEAVDDVAADISPPTDDRPFFFQMADIGTFLGGDIGRDDHVTRPVLVLGLLALTVLGLAGCCIALPLLLAGRSTRERPERRRVVPLYTYFAGIGLGFLLIEIAQLQRLSMFLGHPTYGLTVVLFSVLVFSGIGSMLTERIVRDERRRSLLRPLVALVLAVIASGLATPAVIRAMDGATTPVRIATAVALLAPLALAMGMPFSVGMRAAATVDAAPTAFLWGINGASSVCASVLGVVIALFFGISAAFWCGALMYGIALGSLTVLAARPPQAPRVESLDPEPPALVATPR